MTEKVYPDLIPSIKEVFLFFYFNNSLLKLISYLEQSRELKQYKEKLIIR